MNKIYYSYPEFREDLQRLIHKIDKPFDTIVGIARGGLSMAQMLGEYYNLRDVYSINTIGYEGTKKNEKVDVYNIPNLKATEKVLLVDDIVDSGETLVAVLNILEKEYPHITFYTASIFYKPTAVVKPTWHVREPGGWIVFFWSEDLIQNIP
jgi:xanthine phosphoribosyltransferase